MSTYIIDLISHLTLRKIGLTRIQTLSPPMPEGWNILLVSLMNHLMCLFDVCIFQVFLPVSTPSAGYAAVTHIRTQNAFEARPNSSSKRASDVSTDSSPLTLNRMVCEITDQSIVVLLRGTPLNCIPQFLKILIGIDRDLY